MNAGEPVTNPDTLPDGTANGGAIPGIHGLASRRSLWLWALAAGLLAGLVSWCVGEADYGLFKPDIVLPPNAEQMNSYQRSAYIALEYNRKTPPAERKNTALAYGILGACLGGALGLAGGF